MSSEESQHVGPEAAKTSEAEEAAKRALEAAKRGEQGHRHLTGLATSLPALSLDQEAPRKDVSVPKKISQTGGKEKMSKAIWVALIAAIASIVVAVVSGLFALQAINNQAELAKTANAAQNAANNANQQLNQVAASSAGTLERGQKLCRVIHGNTSRDGLIVPQNWTAALCSDYTNVRTTQRRPEEPVTSWVVFTRTGRISLSLTARFPHLIVAGTSAGAGTFSPRGHLPISPMHESSRLWILASGFLRSGFQWGPCRRLHAMDELYELRTEVKSAPASLLSCAIILGSPSQVKKGLHGHEGDDT